MNNEFPSSIV